MTLRVVGGDPGRSVGLVALDIEGAHVAGSRYLASATMAASESNSISHAERDLNLRDRIATFFRQWEPELVVLEEPFDASTAWRGHTHQQRGTASRLGTYYGMLLSAAADGPTTRPRIVSYPVTNQRLRPGWMCGSARQMVLRSTAAALKQMHAPPEVVATTVVVDPKRPGISELVYRHEHVLMATGVVVYHLSRGLDLLNVAIDKTLARRRPGITL